MTNPSPSQADERLEALFGVVPPPPIDGHVATSQPHHANPNLKNIIKRINAGARNGEEARSLEVANKRFIVPWLTEQSTRWRHDDVFALTVATFVNGQQSKVIIDPHSPDHRSLSLGDVLRFVAIRGSEMTLDERLRLDREAEKLRWRAPSSTRAAQRPPLPASTFIPASATEAANALASLPRGFVRALAQAFGANEMSDRPNKLYSVPDVPTAQKLASVIIGAEAPMVRLPQKGSSEWDRSVTPALERQPRIFLLDCFEQTATARLDRLATMTTFTGRPPYRGDITVPLQAVVIVLVGAKSVAPAMTEHVIDIPKLTSPLDADRVRGAVQYFINCGNGADPIERVLSALPETEATTFKQLLAEIPKSTTEDHKAEAVERFLALAYAAFGDRPTRVGRCGHKDTLVELYNYHISEFTRLELGDDPDQWPKLLGKLLSDRTLTRTLTETAATLAQHADMQQQRYKIAKTRPGNVVHYAIRPVALAATK